MNVEPTPFVVFAVNGVPAPQGSTTKNRYGATYGDNPRTKPWRADIVAAVERLQIAVREPELGPVCVRVKFALTPPKRIPAERNGLPTTTPDLDKLQRALGDALKTARVYKDDSQVVQWTAVKVYADEHGPGMTVAVHRVLS